jgi:hypothetical protein
VQQTAPAPAPQTTCPVVQHFELVQTLPLAQAVPQVPQLASSLVVSTQTPGRGPHWVPTGASHLHVLLVQVPWVAQGWPHPPQLATSLVVSTQALPHLTVPAGQVQVPAWQVAVAGQATAFRQLVPQ